MRLAASKPPVRSCAPIQNYAHGSTGNLPESMFMGDLLWRKNKVACWQAACLKFRLGESGRTRKYHLCLDAHVSNFFVGELCVGGGFLFFAACLRGFVNIDYMSYFHRANSIFSFAVRRANRVFLLY
ncbi:hypothetical protein MTP99_000501 [Tenebrio molitor]|jgi:hypothetical protein|nr:hypothetical protein MTP99_000501 [Tenebrio molitor]